MLNFHLLFLKLTYSLLQQFLNLAKKKKKSGDSPPPSKSKRSDSGSDSESDWDDDDNKKNNCKFKCLLNQATTAVE